MMSRCMKHVFVWNTVVRALASMAATTRQPPRPFPRQQLLTMNGRLRSVHREDGAEVPRLGCVSVDRQDVSRRLTLLDEPNCRVDAEVSGRDREARTVVLIATKVW